jgi:hypothetical protein
MMSFEARCKTFMSAFCMLTLCSIAQSRGLQLGESSPVSVTFYESPGMFCSDSLGACGYGNTGAGPTDFLGSSLYPLHCATGNQEWLGGCGSCLVLSYQGKSRAFVVTDVTDVIDSLDRSLPENQNIPWDAHVDLCADSFNYF